jgi:hypothetical protein
MLAHFGTLTTDETQKFWFFRCQREGDRSFSQIEPEKIVSPGHLLRDVKVIFPPLPDQSLAFWPKQLAGFPISEMRQSVFKSDSHSFSFCIYDINKFVTII